MSISFSTNKSGDNALYINDFAQLASTDCIHWDEVALILTPEVITCVGFISHRSLGVVNYKNKDWKLASEKCTFKVYKSKRNQWSRDENKFVTVDVDREENYLFGYLTEINKQHPKQILTGILRPWINPYFWELDLNQQASVSIAEQLTKGIFEVSVVTDFTKITAKDISDVEAGDQKRNSSGGGGYAKPESESERIAARYDFVQAQFSELFTFSSLYNLAGQIEALQPNSAAQNDYDARLAMRLLELIKITIGR